MRLLSWGLAPYAAVFASLERSTREDKLYGEINLIADASAVRLLQKLAPELAAKDDAGVLLKSLALAKIAAEKADADGCVEIRGIREEHGITVNLRA